MHHFFVILIFSFLKISTSVISVLLLAWVYLYFLFVSHWGECLDWFKSFLMSVAHLLSCVWLLVAPWTVACQASPPMKFSKQEYWSGLPFPTLRGSSWSRDQTHISCGSCIAGRFFTTEPLGCCKIPSQHCFSCILPVLLCSIFIFVQWSIFFCLL